MLKFIITTILVSYLLTIIWRGLMRFLRGGEPQKPQNQTSQKKRSKVNYDNVIEADFEVIEDEKSKSENKV